MHTSGEHAASHQFHQKTSSLPVRLTPYVARLGNCPLKAVRQGARCAVPQIMKALPGIGRSAVAPYETTERGLPCPDGHNTGDNRLSTVTACHSSCADNIINIFCQPAGADKNEASAGKAPGKILPVSQKTIKCPA